MQNNKDEYSQYISQLKNNCNCRTNEQVMQLTYGGSNNKIKDIIICVIGGLFVGFINGFFGGGGGMIVIPILTLLLKMEDKKAHATALLIIFPLSLTSSIIYLIKNSLEFSQIAYCGIGFCAGGAIGALLLKKIDNKALRIVFSIVMIGAGIKMLF